MWILDCIDKNFDELTGLQVSMQVAREHLHSISHSALNQAKLNIMQSLYVLLKSEPLEHDVDMQRACEITECFLQQYFTKEYQVNR